MIKSYIIFLLKMLKSIFRIERLFTKNGGKMAKYAVLLRFRKYDCQYPLKKSN